jgi:hypothetical protein
MQKIILTALAFMFIATPTFAANVSGFAWSESVGWFDFSNATLGDDSLIGYAFNDNTGWLALEGVTNTDGAFGGYAWSESVGYFDFSNASFSDGNFMGYAYNDNTGWLSFENGTVTSTYAPVVASTSRSSSGGTRYGCKDENASNYERFSSHKQSLCKYEGTTSNEVLLNSPSTTQILALIADLRAQIQAIIAEQGVTTQTTPTTPTPYTRDLDLSAEGADVTQLQNFLMTQGMTIPAGATGYFGPQTQAALIQFQLANDIAPAAGYFGPITRAFIATLPTSN